jgi:hypothetical protein
MCGAANAFHSQLNALHSTNGTASSSLLRGEKWLFRSSPCDTGHPRHIFSFKTIELLSTHERSPGSFQGIIAFLFFANASHSQMEARHFLTIINSVNRIKLTKSAP